jgi:aminoglycoside phosphotransferase (APT) family kinase protein
MPAYPSIQTVIEAVCPPATQLIAARMRHMPWSTLYFLTVTPPERRLVVKIVRFPDQTDATTSWSSEELRRRGQREFESLQRVFHHFQTQADPTLGALEPHAYVPTLNAVVMDYAEGVTLYDGFASLSRLFRPGGQQQAAEKMQQAGRWLRHFHTLPLEQVPTERRFTPQTALQALCDEAAHLEQRGIPLTNDPGWKRTLDTLSRVEFGEQVWTHGDFHLRNVFILPSRQMLALDTALERVDSPFFDLGKFTADLKTRRARLLRRGWLPSDAMLNRLIAAFLEGYFGMQPTDHRLLALYEGWFMLQKWNESLDILGKTLGQKASTAVRRSVVDPAFRHILQTWNESLLRQ